MGNSWFRERQKNQVKGGRPGPPSLAKAFLHRQPSVDSPYERKIPQGADKPKARKPTHEGRPESDKNQLPLMRTAHVMI